MASPLLGAIRLRYLGGELTFRFTGGDLAALSMQLRAAQGRARQWQPVWRALKPRWIRITQMTFNQEGPGWAPLSPRYAAWKARHFPGKKILQREGHLISSLTGGPGMIWAERPMSMAYGSALPYFPPHQLGGHNMPQRQMVQVTEEVRRALGELAMRHVMRGGV